MKKNHIEVAMFIIMLLSKISASFLDNSEFNQVIYNKDKILNSENSLTVEGLLKLNQLSQKMYENGFVNWRIARDDQSLSGYDPQTFEGSALTNFKKLLSGFIWLKSECNQDWTLKDYCKKRLWEALYHNFSIKGGVLQELGMNSAQADKMYGVQYSPRELEYVIYPLDFIGGSWVLMEEDQIGIMLIDSPLCKGIIDRFAHSAVQAAIVLIFWLDWLE